MTEEEAKQRWCPFARGIAEKRLGPLVAGNRVFDLDHKIEVPLTFCIGSACMAWRKMPVADDWVTAIRGFLKEDKLLHAVQTYRRVTGATIKEAKDACEEMRDGKRPFPQLASKDDGYCGLAGAP